MPPDVHFPLSSKDRCHGPSARIDAPWAEGALLNERALTETMLQPGTMTRTGLFSRGTEC